MALNGWYIQRENRSSIRNFIEKWHYSKSINGCIADLGAGWGWLSHEALKQNIKKIDLYEAHFPSFQCSKLNIQDGRADFFWIDVLKLSMIFSASKSCLLYNLNISFVFYKVHTKWPRSQ